MGKLTFPNMLFWSLAGLTAVMLVALVLVVGGIVTLESPTEPAGPQTKAVSEPAPEQSTAPTNTAAPAESTTPVESETGTTTGPIEKPGLTLVVLTATRGDSWFSARLGSEEGRLLDERVLGQGESVRLEGRRIWLTVGAAGHVNVTVKPRALAPGTVSVVLAPLGMTS